MGTMTTSDDSKILYNCCLCDIDLLDDSLGEYENGRNFYTKNY